MTKQFHYAAVTKTVALRKILTERCSYAERASVKRIVKGRLGRWAVSVGVLLAVTSASCAAVSQSATDPQAEAAVAVSPEADAITQIVTAAHLADWGEFAVRFPSPGGRRWLAQRDG